MTANEVPFVDLLTDAETVIRSAAVSEIRADVHLDLTRDEDFGVEIRLRFKAVENAETFLDSSVTMAAAMLNGESFTAEELSAAAATRRLQLRDLRAENEFTAAASGTFESFGGLVETFDPVSGERYLYTKAEPYFVHRIFPCFDQPDLGIEVSLTVLAPSDLTVVSAGRVVAVVARGADNVWSFEMTPRIPPYVFNVAMGRFACERADVNGIEVGVFWRKTLQNFSPEPMFDRSRLWLAQLEELFGHEYPYSKLDWVFLPGYSGAMENVAAISCGEYLIPGEATLPTEVVEADGTLAHELAHMWFGDAVTLTWWSDLWLKEAMATLAGVLAITPQHPEAWLVVLAMLGREARDLDQGPNAHAVAGSIPDTVALANHYDSITYFKGALLLRQLREWIGPVAFTAALGEFIHRFRSRAASLSDLIQAFSTASGMDVEQWSTAWLETAGHATFRIERSSDGFRVNAIGHAGPVSLTFALGPGSVASGTVTVDVGPEGALITTEASLILPDAERTIFAEFLLERDLLDELVAALPALEGPLEQIAAWDHLWSSVRACELPGSVYLAAAMKLADREVHPVVLLSVLERVGVILDFYIPEDLSKDSRAQTAAVAWLAVQGAEPGSLGQLIWALTFIANASSDDAPSLRFLLDIAPKVVREPIIVRLVALGAMDAAEVEKLLVEDSGHLRHRVSAATPDAAAKAAAWQLALDSTTTPEIRRALASGFYQPGHEELLSGYPDRYFTAIQHGHHEALRADGEGWYPSWSVDLGNAERAEDLAASRLVSHDVAAVMLTGAYETRRALRARHLAAQDAL